MRDFHLPGRSPVLAANGMCATSHPLAAKTAVDILERGGNAMDAAIAGAVLLGICEPQMTGIGGDLFALFTTPGDETVHAYNGSGRAPGAANAADLRARGLDAVPLYTAEAVTIPGAIHAFCALSADHGRLGLDAVLAPAIRYAEAGVPVAPRAAWDWAESASVLKDHALAHYLPSGTPPKAGAIFRAPGQAEVLRRVAAKGASAFYEGEIADDMLAALNAAGGVHTAADFAAHRGEPAQPISGDYKGRELVEHPPNGQGATAILMLNMLAQFDIAAMDPLGADRAHLEAEATKLAYDTRSRIIADPDHTARTEFILSMETARTLAAMIDPKRALASAAPLTEAMHRDTVYITVVDKDRMAVSLIYSIFHGFGSGIASEKFGILMQNRGAGFTLSEGHPNELAGGKRPFHTIIPGMLRQGGRVTMPFGVMGGAYQPAGHARFLSNIADFGMDPQTAIDAPRSFADKGEMRVERGYSDAVRADLVDRGHHVVIPAEAIGGAQAIEIRGDGVLEGASDPRKDGCALGY
ncbi:gamma-glutamyltransferase 2. Threonine peptidase. MEROPS family T03 [Roseovarius nanhaiticus]|uniref:Gamma-glutamyltransferase 2. Threonine peptidase. MEROPS family T03 n=1 Tax=Roseovarius nanhaiticus TaxID=573024 RepID=A0A1N7F635_9RHOB|nr:gamma-glutamyltransferase family protein [Roseovarius nanhaiticus]SEK60965.1 gamma-glutamyltransferase 2. Threonine peptidase. MEROPS family T03 [Roseovarius nanhaiticus]SIR95783.1 gamma-glutamyltransferase 2. Threonine peptidase. MEROPS family T03 [Roseovarius nanhaiticus]